MKYFLLANIFGNKSIYDICLSIITFYIVSVTAKQQNPHINRKMPHWNKKGLRKITMNGL